VPIDLAVSSSLLLAEEEEKLRLIYLSAFLPLIVFVQSSCSIYAPENIVPNVRQ
jgi:hypothetical protein